MSCCRSTLHLTPQHKAQQAECYRGHGEDMGPKRGMGGGPFTGRLINMLEGIIKVHKLY